MGKTTLPDEDGSQNRTVFLLDDLVSIEGLHAERADLFSRAQLNWLVKMRSRNGLDRAVIKIGRRLYIKRQEFTCWVLSQGSGR